MHLALSVTCKSMFSPVSSSLFSRCWSLSIEKTWSLNWTRTHTTKVQIIGLHTRHCSVFFKQIKMYSHFAGIESVCGFVFHVTLLWSKCFYLLWIMFIFQNGGIKHPKIWRINYGDSNKFQHPLHISSYTPRKQRLGGI